MKILPESRKKSGGETVLRLGAGTAALFVLSLLVLFFVVLVWRSQLSIEKFGLSFLWKNDWNPVAQKYGALSSIFGTLVSTVIAMTLAVPAGFLTAFFMAEVAPPALAKPVGYAVELLAAVPSIIFGMWGLFVLAPIMADHVQPLLGKTLGFLPLFSGPPMGIGMLTAGIILAIMILPFMTSVMRDVLEMTPRPLREAAHGMGATTWEVTIGISLRHGMKGMVGAFFLGLGRAIGETMAVTFVIGNSHAISASLFAPSNTISSTLANEFAEASDALYLSALTELGLVLMVISFLVNAIARRVLRRQRLRTGETR